MVGHYGIAGLPVSRLAEDSVHRRTDPVDAVDAKAVAGGLEWRLAVALEHWQMGLGARRSRRKNVHLGMVSGDGSVVRGASVLVYC